MCFLLDVSGIQGFTLIRRGCQVQNSLRASVFLRVSERVFFEKTSRNPHETVMFVSLRFRQLTPTKGN